MCVCVHACMRECMLEYMRACVCVYLECPLVKLLCEYSVVLVCVVLARPIQQSLVAKRQLARTCFLVMGVHISPRK